MKRALILLALAGCTPQTVVRDRVHTVNIPVKVGCVTGEAEATPSLKSRIPPEQWARMSPSQKAAAVSAQGLRRTNEAERLRASSAGCPKI